MGKCDFYIDYNFGKLAENITVKSGITKNSEKNN